MISGDSETFEHKGADKANKRTCMFDGRIVHENNKYMSRINITILKSWHNK